MQVATWNINGIKARLETALAWLNEAQPDICCLQEIKSLDEAFPAFEFEAMGYNVATHGQKGFNGVAILSKRPFDETTARLPGDSGDEQARYLEAVIPTENGVIRIASIYLPNGNPVGTAKFPYKLAWMDRLIRHARARFALEECFVLAGDYNVIPEPLDARKPDAWKDDALFQPESRSKLRQIENLGYVDAYRMLHPGMAEYTFWDYQAGAWQKNNGIRIDHLLMSPQAADRLSSVRIDKHVRAWEKPSDHVPVVAELGV